MTPNASWDQCKALAEKHTPGPCPGCGTEMVNCGAPIWEDYCPNESCTYERDQMFAALRAQKQASDREKVLRDAAPELLEALDWALPALEDLAEQNEIDEHEVCISGQLCCNTCHQSGCISAKLQRVRAALAKARGQS